MDHLSSTELLQSVRAQATLRLKFGLVVVVLMLAAVGWWGASRPENQAWEVGGIAAFYLAYNFAAYWLAHRSQLLPPRDLIVVTAVLDRSAGLTVGVGAPGVAVGAAVVTRA